MVARTKLIFQLLGFAVLSALATGCGRDKDTQPEGNAQRDAREQSSSVSTLEIDSALLIDDERKNLSGAACESGGRCLLIGDEMRFARLFSLSKDRLHPGKELWLLPEVDAAGEKMEESDGEGIAYDAGYFYIGGSHSRSKKGKFQPSRHHLWRIPVNALNKLGSSAGPGPGLSDEAINLDYLIEVEPAFQTRASPKAQNHLEMAPGVWAPGEDNKFDADQRGVSIEGLAVMGDKLFVGFRGPVDLDGAFLYELPLADLFAGRKPPRTLHRLKLGGSTDYHCQGIRDVAAVKGGLLILSGPEMRPRAEPKLKDGEVAKPRPAPVPPYDRCEPSVPRPELFFWSGTGDPKKIASIDSAVTGGDSPEAIAVLPAGSTDLEILVLSDAGASKPLLLRIPRPSVNQE